VAVTATLVRGGLGQASPPYVSYGFCVWDETGTLVVGPDTGQVGVELTPGMTGAQCDSAAQAAMAASVAQNYPQVDMAGAAVTVL
jgi:hypothetical protein